MILKIFWSENLRQHMNLIIIMSIRIFNEFLIILNVKKIKWVNVPKLFMKVYKYLVEFCAVVEKFLFSP